MQHPSRPIYNAILQDPRPFTFFYQQPSASGIHRLRLSFDRCNHSDFTQAGTCKLQLTPKEFETDSVPGIILEPQSIATRPSQAVVFVFQPVPVLQFLFPFSCREDR